MLAWPARRRRRLSALTPDQAAQTAMPTSTIRNTPGFQQGVYDGIVAAAQAGQFTNFNPSGCPTSSKVSLKPVITSVASGLLLKAASMTAAIPPLAISLAVAGAITGIFSALFGAHAAAVAKEQQVECAAVPAANDSLTAIDQAVQGGVMTPAQGISAMQSLLSEFQQQISSIVKDSPSQCNAGCVWTKTLKAIVAEKISQYQDMQTAAAASPSGSASGSAGTGSTANVITQLTTAAASAGLPSWVLPAAGLLLAWKLFE